MYYVPEEWQAMVNAQDMGVTIYVPGQYPYASGFLFGGGPGETGEGTNYVHPQAYFAFPPNSIFEAEYFLIAGDYKLSRQVIYQIHANHPSADPFSPFGYVDRCSRLAFADLVSR